MITELINFTNKLDEEFKSVGAKPKEGIHILLKFEQNNDGELFLDMDNIQYEQYSKKENKELSAFLYKCMLFQINSWMVDTNKCFDTITRAIHTCSPFSIAIKNDNLLGGANYIKRKSVGKKIVYDSFENYFTKAFELFDNEKDISKYILFRNFFIDNEFMKVIDRIEKENKLKYDEISARINDLKSQQKSISDNSEKEILKDSINRQEEKLLKVKAVEDLQYYIFYIDESLGFYKKLHNKYLDDKLFNTADYNTKPNKNGIIYGTNNFMNSFNSKMPFLIHNTATFDISGRISNYDAKALYELANIFSNKTLPNPLPIFIYEDELLQEKIISIYKESDFKFSYKEIIQKLLQEYQGVLSNYYLLFWQNTRDGLVFKDFDFVSKFNFDVDYVSIQNLFSIRGKGENSDMMYPVIKTVFDFEDMVFKPLIQDKFRRIDYFEELKRDAYGNMDRTFISYAKYRKSVYDFIYKSQFTAIDSTAFDEMVFNSIMDDVKNSNEYYIKYKLNLWYSLYEYFNPKNEINMINQLKEYQAFVSSIINDEELSEITDEKFAYAAGQVIKYILSKSKSADKSYNLLEPYLQHSKCSEFKNTITDDFTRYKHEAFSRNFEKVAAFVLSYETKNNIKNLMPQILSGVFSNNQLFTSTN